MSEPSVILHGGTVLTLDRAMWKALARWDEDRRGSLAPGKVADLVELTMVGGRVVHELSGEKAA